MSDNDITNLKVSRKTSSILSALRDYFGYDSVADTVSFLAQLGVERVEKHERERLEQFPVSNIPVSSHIVTGFMCWRCKEKGIGEFCFPLKGELIDHDMVDRELEKAGKYDQLLLLHPDERVKQHETLRRQKTEERRLLYEAIKQVNKDD
jgi:hypothetical protein